MIAGHLAGHVADRPVSGQPTGPAGRPGGCCARCRPTRTLGADAVGGRLGPAAGGDLAGPARRRRVRRPARAAGTGLLGKFRAARDRSGLAGAARAAGRVRPRPQPMERAGADRPPVDWPDPDRRPAAAGRRAQRLRPAGRDGEPLFGAQPFGVTWPGVLLVEQPGRVPVRRRRAHPGRHEPEFEQLPAAPAVAGDAAPRARRSWVCSTTDWPGEDGPTPGPAPISLRRGAYGITVEFEQREPDFDRAEDICPRHTGFQLKYAGPDTGGDRSAIPHRPAVPRHRRRPGSATGLRRRRRRRPPTCARATPSSLRDIRRTYQRAFKALLFAAPASGCPPSRCPATASPSSATCSTTRRPSLAAPTTAPAPARSPPTRPGSISTCCRSATPTSRRSRPRGPAGDPSARQAGRAVRLVGAALRLRPAARRRPVPPANGPPGGCSTRPPSTSPTTRPSCCATSASTSATRRWYSRYFALPRRLPDRRRPTWNPKRGRSAPGAAEPWLDRRERCFRPASGSATPRPHRWAADDPGQAPDAGNENLTGFVRDGCLENGEPRRYEDVAGCSNDGLRRRGPRRAAGVPVRHEPGAAALRARRVRHPRRRPERPAAAGRRGGAVRAGQPVRGRDQLGAGLRAARPARPRTRLRRHAGVRRAVGPPVRHLPRLAVLRERELYRENWIEWDELRRARRVEAFRLPRGSSCATRPTGGRCPAGWSGGPAAGRRPTRADRAAGRAAVRAGDAAPGPLPEGLDLLGTPERDARPSWLAPVSRRPDCSGDPGGAGRPPADGVAERRPRRGSATAARSRPAPRAAAAVDTRPRSGWARVPPGRRGWVAARVRAGSCPVRPGRDNCCTTCGGRHEALVDEYYFWLRTGASSTHVSQDADAGKSPASDETSDWHRPDKLPGLLRLGPGPGRHLYWSRVHHGEFEPPRRSADPVAVDPTRCCPAGGQPQLDFTGRPATRCASRSPAAPRRSGTPTRRRPASGTTWPPTPPSRCRWWCPGLRRAGQLPGRPGAYPFFAYVCPGAPVEPLSLFSVALTVAGTLRAHCHFEAALKWYELHVAHRWQPDNAWTQCDRLPPAPQDPADGPAAVRGAGSGERHRRGADVPCCPTIAPDDVRRGNGPSCCTTSKRCWTGPTH